MKFCRILTLLVILSIKLYAQAVTEIQVVPGGGIYRNNGNSNFAGNLQANTGYSFKFLTINSGLGFYYLRDSYSEPALFANSAFDYNSPRYIMGIPLGITADIHGDDTDLKSRTLFQVGLEGVYLTEDFSRGAIGLSPNLKYFFNTDNDNSFGLVLKCTFSIKSYNSNVFNPFFIGLGIAFRFK